MLPPELRPAVGQPPHRAAMLAPCQEDESTAACHSGRARENQNMRTSLCVCVCVCVCARACVWRGDCVLTTVYSTHIRISTKNYWKLSEYLLTPWINYSGYSLTSCVSTWETLQAFLNGVWVAIALNTTIAHQLLLPPPLWVATIVKVWSRPEEELTLD